MKKLANLQEIYYIEDMVSKVLVHTDDKTYEEKVSFIGLKEMLPDSFYYANPRIIVNNDMIEEYNYIDCYFILKNGERIEKVVKKYNIY